MGTDNDLNESSTTEEQSNQDSLLSNGDSPLSNNDQENGEKEPVQVEKTFQCKRYGKKFKGTQNFEEHKIECNEKED